MITNEKKRLRDLNIKIGKFPTGRFNAITDVKGVKVGHTTIIQGQGKRKKNGKGPIRTGVTVILPNNNIYNHKLVAGSFVLNGAGEMSGITQVNEWGLLETPITLTNTMSVGKVNDSIVKWMAKRFEKIWNLNQVIIPVVGECDDSFLNDSIGLHIKESDVVNAIESAKNGAVDEGCVGAGTGMICCDFKAGIGTSSRVFNIGKDKYTVGVLVLNNFGVMEELRVDGLPIGKILAERQGQYNRRIDNYGSIITVLATDLPLSPLQIQRLCKRSALGIGRVGSHASHESGEIIFGFSTANVIKRGHRQHKYNLNIISDEFINPAYQAVIEATEESILNSITTAYSMKGVDNHFVPAIDLKLVSEIVNRFNQVTNDFLS